MAQITLNVPAGQVSRVTHALCVAGGFEDETPQNAKTALIEWVKATVRNVEEAEANRAALAAVAEPDVDGVAT